MKNQLTWGRWGAANQHKERGAEARNRKVQQCEDRYQQAVARQERIEKIITHQIGLHLVGSSSNKRLAKRYTAVAKRLTNRSVEVQIREPFTRGSNGVFTRTKNKGYIQLSPELVAEAIVNTFLHEVVHAALHWDSVRISEAHLDPPRTRGGPSNSPYRPALYDAEEDEARELADKGMNILNETLDPLDPDYESQALDLLAR